VGQVRGDQQEVVAGLSDGEQVVTTDLEALHDGQRAQLKR
jgi:hypothetical protein